MNDAKYCEKCEVYYYNADHLCVEYDEAHPCATCGKGTVFVFVSAPGTGSGRVCKDNHFDGYSRELTLAEVI